VWLDHATVRGVLAAREQRILEAVCDALVPPELAQVAPPPSELRAFVEKFVDELPAGSRAGFRAGVWAIAGAALARGTRLDRMTQQERAALLIKMEASPLAPLRLSIKVVCGLGLMALYAAPAVRRKLELPP
jgi:hypothetical protein